LEDLFIFQETVWQEKERMPMARYPLGHMEA
jgi:hypothetical protein